MLPKLEGARGTHIPRKTLAYIKYKEKDIYNAQLALGHTNINSTTKYLPESILRKWK